ncbi:MAG: HAD family hydrolase [Desulfobacteraceae bacterium]|nr:HAD family hydrolase [Desulfobacteraceae bacterium]MBU4054394.1 HAD family hydrolase [Pseudomonadota bacterium]
MSEMNRNKTIKVVAFDCDGVMFDTQNANTAYYSRILEAMGKPALTPEQFEYVHMHTVDSSLSFLFQDEVTLKKARDYRNQMGYLPFIGAMLEEPGLKPLLHKLRPDRKTAVVTNRSDTMNAVLETFHLKDLFDLVVTALDVTYAKPHPEGLEKILAHFKVEPHEVIYVGDSELDAKAAKAAGISLVAYNNPTLGGQYDISALSEIEAILGLHAPESNYF